MQGDGLVSDGRPGQVSNHTLYVWTSHTDVSSHRQLQEMLHIKSAREQQLLLQVQALQSQLGVPPNMMEQGIYTGTGANDPFTGIADLGTDDLRSINDLDLRSLGHRHNHSTIGKQLASPLSAGHEDSIMADQILNDDMAALVDFRD